MSEFSVVPDQLTETAGRIRDVGGGVLLTSREFFFTGVSETDTVFPFLSTTVLVFNQNGGHDFKARAEGIDGFGKKVATASQAYVIHDQGEAASYAALGLA